MNSWCLNLPQRDSSGSKQSPCLIQKRRQISSTLQPTWACLHQWRVSLHSGSRLNWLPLGIFLLTGYSAPLSFWKSLFWLHVFNLWGSDWTYRLWYSLLHQWIAASTQIGCNLACVQSQMVSVLLRFYHNLHEPKSRWRHGLRHWRNLFEVNETAGSSHKAAIILVTLGLHPLFSLVWLFCSDWIDL